jgi:hypothetical protein
LRANRREHDLSNGQGHAAGQRRHKITPMTPAPL